jgi:hypothetical protein
MVTIIANFDPFFDIENMLSPQKHEPIFTPNRPPISLLLDQTSIEIA